MNKARTFLIMIVTMAVFACSFFIMKSCSKPKQPAHDFCAGAHTGEVIRLSDNYGKTPTALIFIDPEIEGSNAVLSKFIARKNDIDVIAVSVSKLSESEQKKLLPSGWDSLSKLCFEGSEAAQKYNIGNAPMIYFIDKDGYVDDVYVASIKESTIDKFIEKLK